MHEGVAALRHPALADLPVGLALQLEVGEELVAVVAGELGELQQRARQQEQVPHPGLGTLLQYQSLLLEKDLT